ncbi:hypothetical protein J4Q44_G00200040 [Coregonus suidteri]|uniref:Tetratricopeptide repeat protein 21A/21B N-terminal ARM repeat domain-containing protein n=1 Tax=Coregonus suidteri TaxID=861788 RepID=A0AAN8LD65_9TELE
MRVGTEDEESTLALINYYCREKYFNHVLNAAAVAQRKFSNYPTFRFVHAYSTLMQGHLQYPMSQEGQKDNQGQLPPEPLHVNPAIIQKARSNSGSQP